LLCFGAGQEHREAERVGESLLVDPPSFRDDRAVHQGDLSGGPTETGEADPRPYAGSC
jgi:hypothetical protein